MGQVAFSWPKPPPENQRVPVHKRSKTDWGKLILTPTDPSALKAVWMGHACFLLRINGVIFLTDPVFQSRCSPSQWVGPKRFTEPPCSAADLPPIDVVLISHNHYDHLCYDTIRTLGNRPKYFVPLGVKSWFAQNFPDYQVTELDWWQNEEVKVQSQSFEMTACPVQHFTGRGVLDRFKTLWCSWAVKSKNTSQPISYYFAGDTGYCSVPASLGDDINPHDPEQYSGDSLPVCPAFKEIGGRLGPFDLACIPIGAYNPRFFMSPIHLSPEDAVQVHLDIKSKKSIGMHWGTWILTFEDPTEPPRRLAKELKRLNLSNEEFIVTEIGQVTDVITPK